MSLVSQLDQNDQSWTMVASIIGCIVSIAYLVATTELDVDTAFHGRVNFPNVNGYIPESAVQQAFVVLGIVLVASGILGAKLIAVTTLGGASASVLVAWCSVEWMALFVLRYFQEGRIWRLHIHSLSTFLPTMFVHSWIYLSCFATPFPFMR